MEKLPPKTDVKLNITLSEEQKQAATLMHQTPVNILLGRAGTGKTLLAVQFALSLYFKRQIKRIIITRPTVSTTTEGFIPGDLKDKMEPWLVPIRSNMRKVYNKPEILEKMETNKEIELISLSHFRGQTNEDAVCIIDEFQNLTREQFAMCLGRLGKNCIMIFSGDSRQIDLRFNNDSSIHIIDKIKDSKYVSKIVLTENHRHEALNEILDLLYKD